MQFSISVTATQTPNGLCHVLMGTSTISAYEAQVLQKWCRTRTGTGYGTAKYIPGTPKTSRVHFGFRVRRRYAMGMSMGTTAPVHLFSLHFFLMD